MRSLIFGGTGMLGRAVVREARRRGWPALGLSHGQADVTDRTAVVRWLDAFPPELVVNCAALTAVDRCETERESAAAVNARAPGVLAEVATAAGARLVHVSSDYVFAGDAREPYPEDAATGPVSAYGASKRAGEEAVLAADPRALVVRSSWLFGPGGGNFVKTILRLLEGGTDPLRVVDDQVGGPTYTPFLARALCDLADAGAAGIVHYQNGEPVSWYGFACAIVEGWAPGRRVEPVTTADFPRPARRPEYSVLATDRFTALVGRRPEGWRGGLESYLQELREA